MGNLDLVFAGCFVLFVWFFLTPWGNKASLVMLSLSSLLLITAPIITFEMITAFKQVWNILKFLWDLWKLAVRCRRFIQNNVPLQEKQAEPTWFFGIRVRFLWWLKLGTGIKGYKFTGRFHYFCSLWFFLAECVGRMSLKFCATARMETCNLRITFIMLQRDCLTNTVRYLVVYKFSFGL